jgi:hypothetical protein
MSSPFGESAAKRLKRGAFHSKKAYGIFGFLKIRGFLKIQGFFSGFSRIF